MKTKVVVVIGASSGIGLEIAKKVQDDGCSVIWCSRNLSQNSEVVQLVNQYSAVFDVDVSSENSVKALFEFVEKKYGYLDSLINCAGFVNPESLLMTSIDNWKSTIDINLTGTFLACKYGSLLMKSTGGKIINIASTAGLTPRPGWSAYAAAKSGVINFSYAIAEELSTYNIKVYIICPGRTATPLRKILAPEEDPTTIMQPSVVADTVMYCMSDNANAIEGQAIIVRERF